MTWRAMVLGAVLVAAAPTVGSLQTSAPPGQRVQDFRIDPGWEAHRSRLRPDPPRITRQEFGYRASRQAGGERVGEIGGWIQRSVTPASYAATIPTRTLENRLTASGRFAVTKAEGSSGMLFGWFNGNSRGWRTPNSLAFRIDGNGDKYWVFFEYGTRHWLSGGAGTFEGERYQTTRTKPFAADGTAHTWSLTYDPEGSEGRGLVTFVLDGHPYALALAPGHRQDGAVFDRFGMFNQMIAGKGIEVAFDDVVFDGRREAFDRDPGWSGSGNQVSFEDRMIRPLHDFGFSPTRRAGGQPGEFGGVIWRDEQPAYCADRVGPLSLEDELSASGRLTFTGAGSDSGVYLGWFDGSLKRDRSVPEHAAPPKSLLAILVEGPSRIGHYFRPACFNQTGKGERRRAGPVIRPDGQPHSWTLRYSPRGAEGKGLITFSLDGETQTMPLAPGVRQAGATFDRFGLFNVQSGGTYVELYVDDLRYTAAREGR